jgi:molybdopterin synthase catalytic subunit
VWETLDDIVSPFWYHAGREVVRLEYEAYVPMAEKVLHTICQEVRARSYSSQRHPFSAQSRCRRLQVRAKWDVVGVALEHRLGVCPVGEASVAIAVSSAHRRDSLEATHYAIDEIKARAPIWKKVRHVLVWPKVCIF